MPIVDVEENIKKLRMNIEQLTQEVFRLQGMLQVFQRFKRGGLDIIDLPINPDHDEEVQNNSSSNDKMENSIKPAENVSKTEISPELLAMGAKLLSNMNNK
jgi:hypothetical protein